jgi:hypothetical protein
MLTTHLNHTSPTPGDEPPTGSSQTPLGPRLPDPHTLKPGSYIYLWAPGDEPGADAPVLARVERTTRDVILAKDLCSQVRRECEVGDAYPAQLRWQWAFVAPPEGPQLAPDGIAIIDRRMLSITERREWLFGPLGTTVRISEKAGGTIVGVVTEVVVDGDQWDVQWVKIVGPTDSRGPIVHRVCFSQIASVTIVGPGAE